MENAGPLLVNLFVILVVGGAVVALLLRRKMSGRHDSAGGPFDGVAGPLDWVRRLWRQWRRRPDDESRAERVTRWRTVAEELGVELVEADPDIGLRLQGTVDGVEVEVRQVVRDNEHPGVVYEADLSDVGPGDFGMERQAVSETFVGLGMMNRDDIYVGDEQLDAEFTFYGDEEAVRQFVWREGVQDALRELIAFPPATGIADGRLEVAEGGTVPSAEHGIERLREMVAIVRRLRDAVRRDQSTGESTDEDGWQSPS